jgi:hypothetical protein
MADVTKEVKIVITADSTSVDAAMKKIKAHHVEMSSASAKMRSVGIKGQQDLQKVSKKTQKSEKLTRGRKAVQAERTLYRDVKKVTAELIKRQKAYKSIIKNVDKLHSKMKAVTSQAKKAGGALNKAYRYLGGSSVNKGMGKLGGGAKKAGGGVAGMLGTMLKGIGGALAGGIMGIVGGAIGILTGQLSGGYSARQQYGRAYGELAGTGGSRGALSRSKGFGIRMGFGPTEMAQQAGGVARATGVVGGAAMRQNLALQRATTLGSGEATGFMGMLTQAGSGFGGKAGTGGKAELVKTLALGMYSGLDRARMPEFFAATTTLVQRQMGASASNVDAGAASSLLAMLGSSGQAGLQGTRGGQVASALDQAIRQPGGGEAGQAFMMQAMGFGKPGGDTSYYEAIRKQEAGTFGKGNLEAMFSESRTQYGGGQAQILALRTLTGLTISQLEAVREVVEGSGTQAEKTAELTRIQEESKSVEEQALDEMRKFGDETRHLARLQEHAIVVGDAIKESVEKIETVINKAVEALLPDIARALERIATAVEGVWEFVQDHFGHEPDVEAAKAKLQRASEQGPKALAVVAAEHQAKAAELREQDAGLGQTVVDGVELLGRSVANMGAGLMDATTRVLGGDVPDRTAAEINEGVFGAAFRESSRGRREDAQAFHEQQAAAATILRAQQVTASNMQRSIAGINEDGVVTRAEQPELARLVAALAVLQSTMAVGQAGLRDAVEETRADRAARPPAEHRPATTPSTRGSGE